jgi:hypothetical protein
VAGLFVTTSPGGDVQVVLGSVLCRESTGHCRPVSKPPERALVLCVDEKSQIQALDRTRPILPLRPGVPARQSHDYVRNGTTSLFAALDVGTGKVMASFHHRQRHQEFLRFLERVDAAIPEQP